MIIMSFIDLYMRSKIENKFTNSVNNEDNTFLRYTYNADKKVNLGFINFSNNTSSNKDFIIGKFPW